MKYAEVERMISHGKIVMGYRVRINQTKRIIFTGSSDKCEAIVDSINEAYQAGINTGVPNLYKALI